MSIQCGKVILSNNKELYFERLLILNYDNIILISDEKMIIDNINIIGNDLKIIELDNFALTIKGEIKGVHLNDK